MLPEVLVVTAGLLVVALLTVAALAVYGAARWKRRTRTLQARLDAAATAMPAARFDAVELEGLPPPVQRYFRAALRDGAPIVAAATLSQAGSFNLGPDGEQWKRFTSTQHVVTRRPGFVWDARIALAPGLAVHVHDAYVGGEGLLQAALLGLFTVADLWGTGTIAEGELMRYLAEAAWYPTALLPSQGVRWTAIDASSARATLFDGAVGATLTVRFGADGLIESVHAEGRGRTVGARIVQTPWEGCWSDYQERAGMMVPLAGEAAWLLPEGRRPYWRGTITTLAYRPEP
jgi:hypothetical protein